MIDQQQSTGEIAKKRGNGEVYGRNQTVQLGLADLFSVDDKKSWGRGAKE